MELPPHNLTNEQLNAKRFGLNAVAPTLCQQLAPVLSSLKAWLTADVRLDRAPGIEHSGNNK